MNEQIIRDALHGILYGEWSVGDTALESVKVSISGSNELLVTLPDGTEYCLTITRGRCLSYEIEEESK